MLNIKKKYKIYRMIPLFFMTQTKYYILGV